MANPYLLHSGWVDKVLDKPNQVLARALLMLIAISHSLSSFAFRSINALELLRLNVRKAGSVESLVRRGLMNWLRIALPQFTLLTGRFKCSKNEENYRINISQDCTRCSWATNFALSNWSQPMIWLYGPRLTHDNMVRCFLGKIFLKSQMKENEENNKMVGIEK